MIGAIFNGVAVWTQHPHWLKDAEQLEPIVGPLCRQIETLPVKSLKAFEKRAGWIMLAGGTVAVVGQDLTAEIKLRAIERAARNEAQGPSRDRRGPSGRINDTGEATAGYGRGFGSDAPADRSAPSGTDADRAVATPPPGLHVDYE